MKKTLKKGFITLVLLIIMMVSVVSVSAAGDMDVLKYSVSSDGYATVIDCIDGVHGVIVIPAKVTVNGKTYSVKYIGQKAFDGCDGITEIHIPEGVTAIKSYAFRDCSSLNAVYVPKSLMSCQYDVFEGCKNFTVYCYFSNYQFFTMYGAAANIEVVVLDADEVEDENQPESDATSTDFITRMITALQNLIDRIKEYFGANDDEFEFPFASEFPFINDLITQFDM